LRSHKSLLVALAVAALAPLVVAASPMSGKAVVNKVEVKGLELGYRVGDAGLRVRLTLASHEAVEYNTDDPAEVERIVQLVQACGSSRARMFAEIERSSLRVI
jgi:hypothetical protein